MSLWKIVVIWIVLVVFWIGGITYGIMWIIKTVDNNGGVKVIAERVWEGKK